MSLNASDRREGDVGYPFVMADPIAEMNRCEYLFLAEIQHPDYHSLRFVIEEGRPAGETGPLEIAGAVISGGTRIDVTEESQCFELLWDSYIAYAVLNESFALPADADECYVGKLFRVYSKSHFIDYLARAAFAASEYPGPAKHYEIACQDHIIEVVSIKDPMVSRLR